MHDGRILDVIVAKQRAASGVPGSCRHRLRLIERQRHRLLAPDMLAGFEKGDRHLAMDIVGRGDRHHIDAVILDELAPIGLGASETIFARALERQLRIDIAQGFEPDVGYVAEDGPHMAPRHGMALAHEARSDQRNAQRRHDNPRPKKAGPDFRRDLHLRQQKTDLI